MDEKQLLAFVHDCINRKGGPISVLDIGMGTGRFGLLLRWQFKDSLERVDGVEVWGRSIARDLRKVYDNIFVGDIREIWGQLGEYDLVILDGIIHYMPCQEFLSVVHRCRYIGETLVMNAIHNHHDENPYLPIADQTPWKHLTCMGGEDITIDDEDISDALVFEKKVGPACALVLRFHGRHALARASIESLLKSWLPPSYLISVIKPDSGENLSYLDSLNPGIHKSRVVPLQKGSITDKEALEIGLRTAFGIEDKPEFIGICDTDMLYNPKWFQMGCGRYDSIKKKAPEAKPAAFTSLHLGANSEWHKYLETFDTPFGKACLRPTSSCRNLIVQREVMCKASFSAERDPGSAVTDMGHTIIGTIPSYVQHIGVTYSSIGTKNGEWAPDFLLG